MSSRGMAWALTMPEGSGQAIYAVVGGTVFGRAANDIWMGSDYGESVLADAAIRTAMSIQEGEGAVLAAGPVEFAVPDDVSDGGGLLAQQIGSLAEQALGLGGFAKLAGPRITFGELPPTVAAPGDMYYETDTRELRTWDGGQWLRVEMLS